MVSDWDGGTRIGDALQAFLAVPRFAGFARGALVARPLRRARARRPGRHASTPCARLAAPRLAPRLAVAARGRPGLPPRDRGARRRSCPSSTELGDGSSASRPSARTLLRSEGRRAHDRDRRRPSPHLAPGRPAVARRARCSRASSAPTSRSGATIRSSEYPRRHRRHGRRRKSVYVQANWAPERFDDEAAWVQAVADETGWPHAIVAYADLTVDDVRPQLDRLAQIPAACAASACSSTGTRTRSTASRRGPTSPRDPALRRNVARLADYGWSFDLQVFAPQMAGAAELARGLPGRHLRPPARRHARGSLRRRAARPGAPACGGSRAQPERGREALRPRHLHPPQRPRPYRRDRPRDGRAVRRRALPVRLELPDREALDDATPSSSPPIAPRVAAVQRRASSSHLRRHRDAGLPPDGQTPKDQA